MRPVVVASVVLAIAGTCPARADTSADVNLENWMARLPGVADLPLTRMPIPGTHDSGSYGIDASSPWAQTGKADFPGLANVPESIVKPLAARWSRTQPRSILIQLAQGIRYVDLRLSREPDGKIYIEHGLRGPEIGEVLDDLATFAATHPKEVVLVGLNRFTNFDEATHALLLAKVRATLGTRMVPASVGTKATLRQIWALDRSVIVLHADAKVRSDPANGDLWDPDTIYSPWPNVQSADDLLAAETRDLADRDPAKIWGLSGTVTPDAAMVARGLLGAGPTSIRELMESVHPALQHWLRHEFRSSVNLVTTDWYDAPWDGGSCFVREVLSAVDQVHPPVPCGVVLTSAGDLTWEPVAGATDYEVELVSKSTLDLHSTTNALHVELAPGESCDVSVRAQVAGAWQAWSLPRKVRR